MFFYISTNIIILLAGLYVSYGNDKKLSLFLKFFLFNYLFFFSAVRYGIGTDYSHYALFYKAVSEGSKVVYAMEPLFKAINKLCLFLNFDFKLFIVICSFITIYFFFKSVEKETFVYEVLIFYALIYIQSFCLIRQMMACTIVLYALKKNFKTTQTIIYLICAALIHSSFWIVFVIYIFSKFLHISINMIIVFIFSSFLIIYFTDVLSFILSKLSGMLGFKIGEGYYILSKHIGMVVLLRVFFMIGFLYMFRKISPQDNICNLLLLGIFEAEIFGIRMLILAARLPQTFYIVFLLLFKGENWGRLKEYNSRKYSLSKFVLFFSIFLMYMVLYIQLMTGFKLNNVVPYQWIF